MGIWVSKPRRKNNKVISLSELNDGSLKEITEVKDLKISQGDFVLEK